MLLVGNTWYCWGILEVQEVSQIYDKRESGDHKPVDSGMHAMKSNGPSFFAFFDSCIRENFLC